VPTAATCPGEKNNQVSWGTEVALGPGEKGKNQLPSGAGDNSNTQFAILALWAARSCDLPLHFTIARLEQRFRSSQKADGWTYGFTSKRLGYGSMTCAGLVGLGVGRGWDFPAQPNSREMKTKKDDEGISKGLQALASFLDDPLDRKYAGIREVGPSAAARPKGKLNLYFLWSVERVGVAYNLKTIGGKDWYGWGVEHLLAAQKRDGSWFGDGYQGSSPTTDTCFALLFLKRADLLPGLSAAIQKRLKITDPGPTKSPGEKSDPKTGTKSPGQKTDIREKEPQLKDGIRKKEGDELLPWQ
jgi:hypothetical protein